MQRRPGDSRAGSYVDADRPHIIRGGELLDQNREVRLYEFVAQFF